MRGTCRDPLQVIDLELPADLDAPGRARQAVRERLAEVLAGEALEDLQLVVSGLVTSVVLNSGDDRVRVRVEYRPTLLRVEVRDGAAGALPAEEWQLLNLLCVRWGIDPTNRTLWAELPAPLA